MYRGNSSRLLPIILIIIVIAISVAALVSIGRALLGGTEDTSKVPDTSQQALLNTSVNYSVRMTVRGPIVADENFRSYRLSVSSSERQLTTYSGYLDQTIDVQRLGNNVAAYDQFVHALDKANFMVGTTLAEDKDDTRGICATGRVYEFEVLNASSVIKRLWTSTCKGSQGSFHNSVTQVQNLFLQQFPDSKASLTKIDL